MKYFINLLLHQKSLLKNFEKSYFGKAFAGRKEEVVPGYVYAFVPVPVHTSVDLYFLNS